MDKVHTCRCDVLIIINAVLYQSMIGKFSTNDHISIISCQSYSVKGGKGGLSMKKKVLFIDFITHGQNLRM